MCLGLDSFKDEIKQAMTLQRWLRENVTTKGHHNLYFANVKGDKVMSFCYAA